MMADDALALKQRKYHPLTVEYDIGDTLGRYLAYLSLNFTYRGAFSVVKKAVHKVTKQPVAVKMIDKLSLHDNKDELEMLRREQDILNSLTHPNVVRLHNTGMWVPPEVMICSGK